MPFPTGDALLISSLLGGCFTILDLGKRQPLEPLYLITAGAVGIISFFAVRAATSTFTWLRRHANENASKVSNTQVEIIRKRGTRLPPPYPSGWYVVAVSNELKPGNVTSVTVCGKNLVVFRTLDNTVGILDAGGITKPG
jgi:hypothetical protein